MYLLYLAYRGGVGKCMLCIVAIVNHFHNTLDSCDYIYVPNTTYMLIIVTYLAYYVYACSLLSLPLVSLV